MQTSTQNLNNLQFDQARRIDVNAKASNSNFPLSLAYDDVLLKPQRSSIKSRRDTNTKTQLTRNIALNIPIVSANMDSVTETEMAIAMARMGGIGIIHRFMSIEKQVTQVKLVKNTKQWHEKEIYTIGKDHTLASAWHEMAAHKVSSLLVVDKQRKLLGILTARDIIFEDDPRKKVREMMTSGSNLITAPFNITFEAAKKILAKHKIEKLPLLDQNGRLAGLITAQELIKEKEFSTAARDSSGRLLVGAAIGVRGDYLERAEQLVKAGADVLVLDIAHGHSDDAIEVIGQIKKEFKVDLIAGNVATAVGTQDLIEAGADAIKVGIGPGSACTTRIVAGVGVPQLSAALECAQIARKYDIPLIADGGIRSSGDIVKALAAGASTVMLGNLLAGCEECPAETVTRGSRQYKVYRGMASTGAAKARQALDGRGFDDEWFNRQIIPEGVESVVPYKGSVIDLLYQLIGGLRSGMSYLNARTIDEIHQHAEFVQITAAGIGESKPHDLEGF